MADETKAVRSNRLSASELVNARNAVVDSLEQMAGMTLAQAAACVSLKTGRTVTGDNMAYIAREFNLDWGRPRQQRTRREDAKVAEQQQQQQDNSALAVDGRVAMAEQLAEQMLERARTMDAEIIELKAQVAQLQDYGNEVYASNTQLTAECVKLRSAMAGIVVAANGAIMAGSWGARQ